MKTHHTLRATDHRAVVLESVATHPLPPTTAQVCADSIQTVTDLNKKNAGTMLSTLHREGLVGLNPDHTWFLTKAGFDWLTNGHFDRAIPTYAKRPKNRKRKGS